MAFLKITSNTCANKALLRFITEVELRMEQSSAGLNRSQVQDMSIGMNALIIRVFVVEYVIRIIINYLLELYGAVKTNTLN